MKQVRIIVAGRVQGVGYRDWTIDQARSLGLSGWVRNRRDGDVEMFAAGAAEAVEELARRCWQGPSMACVASVSVEAAPDEPAPAAVFERRPTG